MLLDAASVDLKHPSSTGSSVTVLRYLSTALLMESIGVVSGMFLMWAGRALKRKAAFPLNEFLLIVLAAQLEFLCTAGGTRTRPLLGASFQLRPIFGTSLFMVLKI